MEAMRRFLRRISAEVDSADRVPAVTAATAISHVTAMLMVLMPPCSNRILAEARLATPVLYVRVVERGAVIDSFIIGRDHEKICFVMRVHTVYVFVRSAPHSE